MEYPNSAKLLVVVVNHLKKEDFVSHTADNISTMLILTDHIYALKAAVTIMKSHNKI